MNRKVLADIVFTYGLELIDYHTIDSGYINQTFKIVTNQGSFVLQRINPEVFLYPERIVQNENKLRKYLESRNNGNILVPIQKTPQGENFYVEDKVVWRMTKFMENFCSPHFISSTRTAYSLGSMLGKFHNAIQGLDGSEFQEVIPGFHDLNLRFEQFNSALRSAEEKRSSKYATLLDEIEKFSWLNDKFNEMTGTNGLRKIVCHNDTKIGNTLTDCESGEVKYLIDLDTIMPGYAFTDVGDAVRAGCSKSAESESNADKVSFDHELFDSILDGYLSIGQSDRFTTDRNDLATGAMIMLYMQALRFMADFLNGNKYYKVNFEDENAIRARNQMILLNQLYQYLK